MDKLGGRSAREDDDVSSRLTPSQEGEHRHSAALSKKQANALIAEVPGGHGNPP